MIELRDRDLARRFLAEGLWLQRLTAPSPASVRPALEWALELAGNGMPLPPIGLVADIGQLALSAEPTLPGGQEIPGWPAPQVREYEDLVLGKLLADTGFERAADALRRYQGRDRARGLAFLIDQFRQRAGCGGVLLSPAVVRSLLETKADAVLAEGWDGLMQHSLLPELAELYRELTPAVRRLGDVLGAEDIFELEQGTALLELGQRLALRQVLQAAVRLSADLPPHRVRPAAQRRDVATQIHDEDIYPVGGYVSVSNRGAIESLLPSQLAYMENDPDLDLFDVKYVRDELLFYSRDENQFLRRRQTFVIALDADLAQARFKDAELPWQRIVLTLGLLVAAVRKLTDWLSEDALVFDFCVIGPADPPPLAHEWHLLELIFRTAIANGTVRLTRLPDAATLSAYATRLAKRSVCHCLWVAAEADPPSPPAHVELASLMVQGPSLELQGVGETGEPATGLESWGQELAQLVNAWA